MTRSVLEVVGLVLVALGVGLYALPAGVIVAGLLLALWANFADPLRAVTEESTNVAP